MKPFLTCEDNGRRGRGAGGVGCYGRKVEIEAVRWYLVEELEHSALRVLGCRDSEVDAVLLKRSAYWRRRQDM
jgi:hypothetical protein